MSSSATEPMNIGEELTHAETRWPKVRIRPDRGNPSEAERDERNATHLPFRSRCEHRVAGKMPDLPHKRRSSVRDAPETQRDYNFTNRKSDSELMTVLNFLDCGSGCTFACAVDFGPGDFLVTVICKGLKFGGRKRFVLRTGREHAVSAVSTAVCQARTEETILENSPKYSSASMGATGFANPFVEGQIRTVGGRLEHVLKIEINITDAIVSRGRSTRLLVAEPLQNQVRWLFARPCHQRKAIWRRGGRVG